MLTVSRHRETPPDMFNAMVLLSHQAINVGDVPLRRPPHFLNTTFYDKMIRVVNECGYSVFWSTCTLYYTTRSWNHQPFGICCSLNRGVFRDPLFAF